MDVKITFNDFTVTGANALNNVTIKLLKGEKGDPGTPTDAQVQTSVNTWLAAHPEATTTVQDGAISYAKLDSSLKATVDDVSDLKSSLCPYNCIDVLAFLNRQDRTHNGITFTWNDDGSCTVSGTATANAFCFLWSDTNSMPPFVKAGDTLRLKVDGIVNSSLRIWGYKGGTYVSGFTVTGDREITLPTDIDGLMIRVQVEKGKNADETVKFVALSTYTNDEIYDMLKAKADDVDGLKSSIGDLDDLETDDTESIVAAINWLYENGGGTPAPTYTITNNLTNVTNSNGASTVREGKAYTATLALVENAVLDSVTVTMGGTDITSTAWDANAMTVSIASVTNNIVITAVASIVITTSVTWSGTGTDKTSTLIDATQHDVYWEFPYVEGASQYAEGVTENSEFIRLRAILYGDSAATNIVGYWYIDRQSIEDEARTTLNSPIVPTDTLIMVAPMGYYVKLVALKRAGFYSNATCGTFLNTYAKTVTLKQPTDEPEPEETISNAESVDSDLLRNYTLNAVSLTTDTVDDSTSYAGVIETAKNEWMTEYGGNVDKIPLIIHTDQHDSMGDAASQTMWETIDGMVSWYDVSKVLNLGDTTNSYDNYDNPLLGDPALEKYLETTKSIPFSKRIEVFGNHDCMKIINASLTYIPQAPNYLNPYFKNVMARRTSNNGNWCVTYDDYFNVKYVIYSTYDWLESLSTNGVTTEQYDFLIDELSKNDGYDVILLGHTDVDIYRENTGRIAKARYEKTSGSFTDRLGVTHTYDFTQCENDLLVCLHGHSHDDGYNYTETVLSQCFANYYDSTRPIYFVIVDRANRQLKIWKVTNTPEYTLTTRALTESA